MTIFLLVNGRTPNPPSFCALCGERIGENYLREISTRLSYCDHQCYAGHCDGVDLALSDYARPSKVPAEQALCLRQQALHAALDF
ncbi:MAG TPA: hypothetical protein VLU23_00205 [Pseudolabrys sp.]|jgi:hypothetical protein|nr:hypothetical protein [Pseudolabrys sp.]